VTTGTRHLTLIRRRRFKLQQLTQGTGSGIMERDPQGALDGFQIGAAVVVPAFREDAAQQ